MANLRNLARRVLPPGVRLGRVMVRRLLSDRRQGFEFASAHGEETDFGQLVCSYSRPFIDYPGQEQLAAAKRRNQALLASYLDGIVIGPGEVFSVWRLAPRPSLRLGYGVAAAIRNGELTSEVGGAVCLLSTVLYNIGLLGGLDIIERHCHSVDSYGDERYFELGRDAAIEYGYADLRFRNSHEYPVLLSVEVGESEVSARLLASVPTAFRVEVEVDEPLEGGDRLYINATRRILWADGRAKTERLPASTHWKRHAHALEGPASSGRGRVIGARPG